MAPGDGSDFGSEGGSGRIGTLSAVFELVEFLNDF